MTVPGSPAPVVLGRSAVRDGSLDGLVLRCGGEIDAFNASQLQTAVGDELAQLAAATILVVDLRDVSFLGASAITALLAGTAHTPSDVTGPRLVVGNTRPVLIVINALDLYSTFSIHHDIPDAFRGRAHAGTLRPERPRLRVLRQRPLT